MIEPDQTSLYKYFAAFGSTTISKCSQLKIFLYGLRGTGSEIAKNLMLSNIKELVIQDDEKVKLSDLCSNAFLSETDIGNKIRSEACLPKLKLLNGNVALSVNTGEIKNDFFNNFHLVIITDYYADFERLIDINNYCRTQKKTIGFIYAGCIGILGFTFIDFGDKFKVYDKDGENTLWYAVDNITKSNPGVVTINSSKPHKLDTGDFVSFYDIEGMKELNSPEARPIKVLSPYAFTIEDTEQYGDFIRGGRVERVNVPFIMNFKSFEHSLTMLDDDEKNYKKRMIGYERYCNSKLALYSLCFYAKIMGNGNFPSVSDEKRIEKLVDSAKNLVDEMKMNEKFDPMFVKKVVLYSKYQIAPLCSVIGGIASLEAIKYCGKFTPLKGFFFYDIESALPEEIDPQVYAMWDYRQKQTRYDDQILMFGNAIQEKIQSLRVMLIGAGCTASEYVKNFSLMGLSTASNSKLRVADDSLVTEADINSYFPYTIGHIGKEKAILLTEEGLGLNPKTNYDVMLGKIDEKNPIIEADILWDHIDLLVSAVDYLTSKNYLNIKSIWYEKPMLTTVAQGLACCSEIIIPHLTEDFNDVYARQQVYDSTLVWKFPYMIEHIMQWAREVFNMYVNEVSVLCKLLSTSQFSLKKRTLLDKMKDRYLFNDSVNELTTTFPRDYLQPDGKLLWSGYYRFPTAISFNINDDTHYNFIIATAKIFAIMLNISSTYTDDVLKLLQEQDETINPIFKIENEEKGDTITKQLEALTLPANSLKVNEIILDDQNNRGLFSQFLTSTVNLKARCYGIPETTRYKVEKMVFNIKVNLPLTNAIIVGLGSIEIYKLLQKKHLEEYRNYHIDLGVGAYVSESPKACAKKKLDQDHDEFSLWDKLVIEKSMTIDKVLQLFYQKYGAKIARLYYENVIFYDQKQKGNANETKTPREIMIANNKENICNKKFILELYYELESNHPMMKGPMPRIKYQL